MSTRPISAISTTAAPVPAGPYSQAIRAGDLLFLAGQIPVDPATGRLVEGDIRIQTRQVLTNLGRLLEEAGGAYANVVRTTLFLADIGDLPAVNEVYATFFAGPPPARSSVQVARLPADARIEVDAIAAL